MSLRLRLFLLLGTLIALLVVAQWWMIHALSEDLSQEVNVVALTTARSTVEVITEGLPPEGIIVSGPDTEAEHEVSVRVIETQEDSGDVRIRKVQRFDYSLSADEDGDLVLPRELKESSDLEAIHRRMHHKLHELGIDPEQGRHSIKVQLIRKDGEEHDGPHALVLNTPEGVKEIPILETPVDRRVQEFRQRMLGGTLAILALGLLFAGVVAHRVSSPLRRLAGAAQQVGKGRLGEQVPGEGPGEVGQAIGAFNHMSRRLAVLEADTRRLRGRQHLSELGEVARGLAHTLRNPLNALGLSVEEMASGGGDKNHPGDRTRRTELAESARRQIRRIDGAVRSILALAGGGAGKPEPVQVGELAQDVALEALQDTDQHSGNKGGKARIEVDVAPNMAPLPAVAPELRAVLQALVVNAVEAGPPGGRVTVRVQPGTEGEAVRVEVEDEGPGVAPQVRDRLFTPHVTTKPHGSGMGLFLAQRIAGNRYDGAVQLEDRLQGGTRAVLILRPRVDMNGDRDEH